jgi:hypothetical protein
LHAQSVGKTFTQSLQNSSLPWTIRESLIIIDSDAASSLWWFFNKVRRQWLMSLRRRGPNGTPQLGEFHPARRTSPNPSEDAETVTSNTLSSLRTDTVNHLRTIASEFVGNNCGVDFGVVQHRELFTDIVVHSDASVVGPEKITLHERSPLK